jgi:hypothetical protein
MGFDLARRNALLALLGGGAGLSAALRSALARADLEQGMRTVQGNVSVNGKPAGPGTPVRAGDTVRTGNGALATFVIGQDAFLLRERSRAEFAGSGGVLSLLRLTTGKLLSVFGRGERRSLVTPTATIGIRGTGGYLEVQRRRTYFCLCYGSAEVAPAGSAMRETYSTSHHESPKYIYGDGRKAAMTPATAINHTDDELIMLEALVGRKPPESFMESAFRY